MYPRDALPLLVGLAYSVIMGSPISMWWTMALPYLAWGLLSAIADVLRHASRRVDALLDEELKHLGDDDRGDASR